MPHPLTIQQKSSTGLAESAESREAVTLPPTPLLARSTRRNLFASSLRTSRLALPERFSKSVGPNASSSSDRVGLSLISQQGEDARVIPMSNPSMTTDLGEPVRRESGLPMTPAYLRTPSRRTIVLQSTGRLPRPRPIQETGSGADAGDVSNAPASSNVSTFSKNITRETASLDNSNDPQQPSSLEEEGQDIQNAERRRIRQPFFTPLPSRLRNEFLYYDEKQPVTQEERDLKAARRAE